MEVKSSNSDSMPESALEVLPSNIEDKKPFTGKTPKVLFIDRNPLVISTVHSLLTKQGIECLKANSALEGLFQIALGKPGIVFIEAGAARIEDLWLWEILGKQSGFEDLFWVMVTREKCGSEEYTAEHADIDAILSKPFGSRELLCLINKAYEDILALN